MCLYKNVFIKCMCAILTILTIKRVCVCVCVCVFGHTTRLIGSQFPNQGSNPGPDSENIESLLLDSKEIPMYIPFILF